MSLLPHKKNLNDFLEWVQTLPGEIACLRTLPERKALFASWPDLDPRLVNAFAKRGIEKPYTHQAKAIFLARAGKNVVIVTPTASGKSLCYMAPILDAILRDPASRALCLFPTKALSADQLSETYALVEALGVDIKTFTYDGDTPPAARMKMRAAGHLVITNPDMLHTGILPHHTKWEKLFENLRYVVIDELHSYRGVFGSHLANLFRRLRRLCAHYGSSPSFICCSATIANPKELAEALLEEPVELVTENGAPQGEKKILIYNPPLVNRPLGIRKSSLLETAQIATEAIANDISTICFSRSRLDVELLLTYIRRGLVKRGADPESVMGYRGGYLPRERREIEQGLRNGKLKGVVSTNALELGIDIGSLDLALLHGYPGSVASAWQQMGRAGRRSDSSAAIIVASSMPLDQFLAGQPSYFFGASPERARINPDNLYIQVGHVKCSAFELPFREGETFGKADVSDVLEYLDRQGVLHKAEERYYWQADSFPAESLSLRSATSENYVILDITDVTQPRVIGEVDRRSAPTLIHPEAIYFHGGESYQVVELDAQGMRCLVKRVDVDYYTDADTAARLEIIDRFDTADPFGWGEVLLASRPTVYKKIRLLTHENVGYGHIYLDEEQMHTTACWLAIPETGIWKTWEEDRRSTALSGLAHLMRTVAPLFLMCAQRDLHVQTMVKDPFFDRASLYLSDNYPGGVGLAEAAFVLRRQLLASASEAISGCRCENGCPACVGAYASGLSAKQSTRELLECLIALTGSL